MELVLQVVAMVLNPLAKMLAKLAVMAVKKTSIKEDDAFLLELAKAIVEEHKA